MAKSKATVPDDSTRVNKVKEWNTALSAHKPLDWDRLPDIELYMDQVVQMVNRQLNVFRKNDDDKIITSSMINNYTKDKIIPRAESKKYSREHIALLLVVCSLKKIISIPDLAILLEEFRLNSGNDIEKFYKLFNDLQAKGIEKTSRFVKETLSDASHDSDEQLLRNAALKLAVEGQLQCIAAEQILGILKSK